MFRVTCLLTLFVWFLILLPVSGADPKLIAPNWVKKVQDELPESFQHSQNISRSIDEIAMMRVFSIGMPTKGKSPNRTITLRSSILDSNSSISVTRENESDKSEAPITTTVSNRDYSFSLTQSKQESPYVLREYTAGTPSPETSVSSMAWELYSELAHLLDAVNTGRNGHRLIALNYDDATQILYANILREKREQSPAQNREIWVEPAKNWRPLKRVIRVHAQQTITSTLTYGTTVDGVFFPNLMVEETNRANGNNQRLEVTFEIKKTTKTPNDFRLSAFGLPEPVDVQEQPKSRALYWYIGGAIVFANLAIMLRWVARRGKRKQQVAK